MMRGSSMQIPLFVERRQFGGTLCVLAVARLASQIGRVLGTFAAPGSNVLTGSKTFSRISLNLHAILMTPAAARGALHRAVATANLGSVRVENPRRFRPTVLEAGSRPPCPGARQGSMVRPRHRIGGDNDERTGAHSGRPHRSHRGQHRRRRADRSVLAEAGCGVHAPQPGAWGASKPAR